MSLKDICTKEIFVVNVEWVLFNMLTIREMTTEKVPNSYTVKFVCYSFFLRHKDTTLAFFSDLV